MTFVVVRINTTGKILNQLILKKMKRFDQMNRKAMRAFGNKLVTEMVRSAKEAGIRRFNGVLFRDIKWTQTEGSNYGRLTMPMHGIFLDRMTPHRFYIKKKFGMRVRWARQAQNTLIRSQGTDVSKGRLDKFYVYVKPHPFIKTGYRRARRQLPNIIKTYMANKK